MINLYVLVGLKLIIGFLMLIIVINLSGKGNLAPTSASDQIQNYVLGGIIGGVIYNKDIGVIQFLLILSLWTFLVFSFKWIKTYNVKIKHILDGKALILINNGKIYLENCKKVNLSAHDLAFKLRMQQVYSIKKVKRAMLEQNGQLIIVREDEENPKYPLITDGQLQKDILDIINKDETWLINELNNLGIEKISDVYLAEYENGKILAIEY